MNEDEKITDICKKIDREKALINAAHLMRQQTNNDAVRSKLDSQMRDGRRNLEFFEERLRELQARKLGQGMDNLGIHGGGPGSRRPGSADYRGDRDGPPAPPPKDASAWDASSYGSGQYGQPGQPGEMMGPRHSLPGQPPNPGGANARPNFTKLGRSTLLRQSDVARPLLIVVGRRPDQIRHPLPRAAHSAHAVADPVQAQRRGTVPKGHREDGSAVPDGG